DRDGEVVARPAEDRVRGDVHLHVQIARGCATAARLALPGQPDALLVVHPRWDAHGQRARPGADAFACAFRARGVDDRAPATAVSARFGERERALAGVDQAGAATRRAHARVGAGRGARACARATL